MAVLRAIVGLLLLVFAWTLPAGAGEGELPQGTELPVRVRIALRILDVTEIKEVAGKARLWVEVTQRWRDPRDGFDTVGAGAPRIDRVGEAADKYLEGIWTPGVVVDNQIGDADGRTIAVSAHADGTVVVVERYEADFRVATDMNAFPFDRQKIALSFSAPRHAKQDVLLVATDADRSFSKVAERLSVTDWRPLRLDFANRETAGWNARNYSNLEASLSIERLSERYILRIFIPIAAVLAVSIYVLWAPGLGQTDKGGLVFSALLALAAVSFTFESSFPGSISLNTPIAQIISIGYVYLVAVLLLDSLLGVPCGRPASRLHRPCLEMRRQMSWALPAIMTTICAGAVLRALPV